MEYWVWLTGIKGVGTELQKRLLKHFHSPKAVYDSDALDLREVEGIGKTLSEEIRKNRALSHAHKILERAERSRIEILTYDDERYPEDVRQTKFAPTLLYYKGTIRKNSMGVAIVGARRCSQYGKEATIETATYLSERGIPVISGMAKGIDGYAHTAALKAGGYTLAFLGHGLNHCYPKEHRSLMEAIEEKGALLTVYPPDEKPMPMHFPDRNRLFVSWSKKVLVIEAGEKSGSLLTANYALEEGRPLFVLPHEIYHPGGKGGNKLLLDGATVYLKAEQLTGNDGEEEVEAIGKEGVVGAVKLEQRKRSSTKNSTAPLETEPVEPLPKDEQKILKALKEDPLTIKQLENETGISYQRLLSKLFYMELEGKVYCRGGYYRRK